MVSEYLFAIVATMMLSNGLVLAIMSRDLPDNLRPAAHTWQAGTFLIAIGCGLFAIASERPPPMLLVIVNTAFLIGLLAYNRALAKFYGFKASNWLYLPIAVGAFSVFWFSMVDENFQARIIIITIAWCWLMLASIRILARPPRADDSISRRVLLIVFMIMAVFTALRASVFLFSPLPTDFSVTTGASTVNVVTPIFMAVLPVLGTTSFILLCSDRIRLQWEHAASTDYLTGLPNRRTLTQRAEQLFKTAGQAGAGLSVAIFDIDSFKKINDTHGHDVGDRALQHVADILSTHAGNRTMVVLLLDGPPEQRLEGLRKAVEDAPCKTDGKVLPLTVSIGVASRGPSDADFSGLLRRADRALYAAKSLGRNRVEVSTPEEDGLAAAGPRAV
jgi:diguanylate cyclase (GGDEF)-like protein